MISTNFKLRIKGNGKMLNFVEGYKATLGLGPIWWTYWVHDPLIDRTLWKKETILDDLVEKVPYIGIEDDTTWGMLSQAEMEYWIAKGYNIDNWRGKPAFVNDIVKYVCEGEEDRLEIIQLGHLTLFKDSNSCVKEIPCDRAKCKMYIIGNSIQNPYLLEDIKTQNEKSEKI